MDGDTSFPATCGESYERISRAGATREVQGASGRAGAEGKARLETQDNRVRLAGQPFVCRAQMIARGIATHPPHHCCEYPFRVANFYAHASENTLSGHFPLFSLTHNLPVRTRLLQLLLVPALLLLPAASGIPEASACASEAPAGAACCKRCKKGKPCGDTCIARNKTCHVGRGCACAAG